jgi:heme/copper-type cytochrome/quinol oxidase subunit 4
LKYGRYYNSFFASGLAAMLILVGLFLYMGYKKYQRTNPMGIMFNLVLIQIMLTFRIFLVGLFFQIW